MLTIEEARARVARGVALLDRKVPEWWSRIDLAALRLQSVCSCIRGQLGGPMWTDCSLAPECLDYSDNVAHGFAMDLGVLPCESDAGYALLQEEWLRVIRARLAEEQDAPLIVWTARERSGEVVTT